jgi:hypothetical protein
MSGRYVRLHARSAELSEGYDLLTRLEQSDVASVNQAEIDASREAVAADMGW